MCYFRQKLVYITIYEKLNDKIDRAAIFFSSFFILST
jgi:hypothetical protein